MYGLIGLILIALMSVISYGHGFGYVYIYWREFQIQSNLLFIIFGLLFLSLIGQICWRLLKKYIYRKQRQTEEVFDFNNLHSYEQLAVIWLLDAAREKQDFIQSVFQNSILLNELLKAKLSILDQKPDEALLHLEHSSHMVFELATLQKIEIYLSQNDAISSLTHLEFLNQHQLSPWLKDVEQAYGSKLNHLWGVFAQKFPWKYLESTQYGHLDEPDKVLWLEQLLLSFDGATTAELEGLKQRYLGLVDHIYSRHYDIQVLWLKVISQLPDLAEHQQKLAEHLLEVQFNQDVFYLWFQQQMLRAVIDFASIEKRIDEWVQKYISVPVLTYAKWHVLNETSRFEQADALLEQYPEDVLMSYLRIRKKLNEYPELIRQLNLIFESNANFVKIKL